MGGCNNCDFDSIKKVVSAATPVPCGVGAVTTMVLGKHYIQKVHRLFCKE